MIKFRPDVVIGFGSLVSIPVVMLAWLFRIKILIHEQNVIPGRANRFLIRFSDKAAITFSETEDYFKGYQRKLVLTGNPLRKELSMVARNKALDFFSFANDKFTIFVMGGSSGSNRINSGFLKAIRTVSDRDKLQIVHLTGLKDYDLLKDKYKDLQVNIRLFKFLEAIEYAYSVADLVISRAGANAITEIIFFKLPAIIIPYPYAYRHQLSNAKILESIDSGIIIQDRELDTDILRKTIDNLINNPGRIEMMRSAYDKIHRPNSAADLLVNTALSLN